MKYLIIYICLIVFLNNKSVAENSKIRVCSQNMYRLGDRSSIDDPRFKKQLSYLVSRIRNANCSIVGMQEFLGDNNKNSKKIAQILINSLYEKMNKEFEIILSSSNDSYIKNGFLISKSDFYIERTENWNHNLLPKIDVRSAPWSYVRGPLVVKLKIKDLNNSNIGFFIVNDHLKSKSKGWKDPSNTQYEISRVLSASAIKERLLKEKSDKLIEIFLGDRNTSETGASALILSGRVNLKDFQKSGECEITAEGSALCPENAYDKPDMIPLLETANIENKRKLNTFRMQSKEQILDEIYIFHDDQKYVINENGRFSVGTEGEYKKGSDHLLSWAEFSFDNY